MRKFIDKVYSLVMNDNSSDKRVGKHKITIVAIFAIYIAAFIIITTIFLANNIKL